MFQFLQQPIRNAKRFRSFSKRFRWIIAVVVCFGVIHFPLFGARIMPQTRTAPQTSPKAESKKHVSQTTKKSGIPGLLASFGKVNSDPRKVGVHQVVLLQRERMVIVARRTAPMEVYDFPSGRFRFKLKADAPIAVTRERDGFFSRNIGMCLWDFEKKRITRSYFPKVPAFRLLEASPTANVVAGSIASGYLVLVDTKEGKITHRMPQHGGIRQLSISGDGRFLAVGDATPFFTVWRFKTGQVYRKMPAPVGTSGYVDSVDLSPDGEYLVASTSPGTFVLHLPTQKTVRLIRWPVGGGIVELSPDGRLLAIGTGSHITIWEFATGKKITTLAGHAKGITSLSFSDDGRYLCSGSYDNTAKLWDLLQTEHLGGWFEDRLDTVDFQRNWRSLADPDARVAFKSMRFLVRYPKTAIKELCSRLKPIEPKLSAKVRELIDQLGNDSITYRKRAAQELKQMGSNIRPALAQAFKKHSSEKVQDRAGDLYDTLAPTPLAPIELRQLRAIQVLQWIGNEGSVQCMRELAKGEPLAWQTNAAKAALRQMSR